MDDYEVTTRSGRCIKYNQAYVEKYVLKKNQKELIDKIKEILSKSETERSHDDCVCLKENHDLVEKLEESRKSRAQTLAHLEIHVDDKDVIEAKCEQLANIIKSSKNCIVYTGAGISTAASIPDYRGPNGLWTMLKKGIKVETPDFARVQPTYSHMFLKKLLDFDQIKYIVSQNCDGLHVRSGVQRDKLAELHGNCFIEQCKTCHKEYIRLFDVTENTRFRKHNTNRFCSTCNQELQDTIIHFGEKLQGGLPYNIDEAHEAVKQSDCIICIGSSLKVLKHYGWLWPKNLKSTMQLCIINIQWTPKDKFAKLKINGYCDTVLKTLAKHLNINDTEFVMEYKIQNDPIVHLAIKLKENEKGSAKTHINDVTVTASSEASGISSNSWYNRSFKK